MRCLSFQSKSKRRGGFTILELLAAMTILSMLVVMLVATFSQASRSWLQAENRVETYGQARAALDFMTKELTQTVTTTNSSFLGSANGMAFVAAVNTNGGMDLVGVSYQLNNNNLTRGVLAYSSAAAAPSTWTNLVSGVNTVAENVVSLTLSYDGNGTSGNASWDSTGTGAGRAPAGVQITIGIIDSRAAKNGSANLKTQATQTFSTYVSIPNGQ